jgi:hypothetical protein
MPYCYRFLMDSPLLCTVVVVLDDFVVYINKDALPPKWSDRDVSLILAKAKRPKNLP